MPQVAAGYPFFSILDAAGSASFEGTGAPSGVLVFGVARTLTPSLGAFTATSARTSLLFFDRRGSGEEGPVEGFRRALFAPLRMGPELQEVPVLQDRGG